MTPKIALDPHMYHGTMSVADELRHAADLGYSYLELSPRADWFFWQRYPKADDALIAETKKAAAETGVQIVTLVPVFNWSSPDEQERQAQVRNWRRLLQIANDLECPLVNSEFSGDPNRPLQSEHAFYRSVEELVPDFERYGIGLNIEAHPYDFSETNDDAVQIVRGINKPWVNYVFCAPHAFHLSDGAGDVRRMMTYAGGKLQHVHVADNVFLGPNAVLTNDLTPRSRDADWVPVETWIEEGVTIGANATIVCGVRLGARCLVGAGAVVTRDVRPHELVYGNPARHGGWVCFCAQPLQPSDQEITTCERCGRQYKAEENGVQEVA